MMNDTLIRHKGMKVLREKLGIVEAEKFITLLRREPFDYTEWRTKLWDGVGIDELFNAARKYTLKTGKKPHSKR